MQRILQPDKYIYLDEDISDVAQLNNNIYVLHYTFLAVYDAVSFKRLKDVKLLLKRNPIRGDSIAACSVNQCLYVAGRYSGGSIIRLKINNGVKTVIWMKTTVDVMYNKKFVHLYSNIVIKK